MMTTGSLAPALVSMPTSAVEVTKRIILDWCDGPLEGFISIEYPSSHWYFRIVAGNARSDDVDDRLFALAQISDKLMNQVFRAVSAESGRRNEVPDPSIIDHASLSAVLEKIDQPEIFAVFSGQFGIERAWLAEPHVVVWRGRGR